MKPLYSLYQEYLSSLEQKKLTTNIKTQRSLAVNLATYVEDIPANEITYQILKTWFNDLTYYQQHKAKIGLERFFDEMIMSGELPLLKHNPFGKGTGKLWGKQKPPKARQRLLMAEFKFIRNCAIANKEQWFVNALDLAYLLKLRRQDVITLTFKNHDKASKTLSKAILKSMNQKGEDKGQTLIWDLTEAYGRDAAKVIATARTTRLIDLNDKTECSPYVIHCRPQRIGKQPNKEKTHHTQVTEALLSRTFQKYRDMNPDLMQRCEDENTKRPTFHEIRSLSARNDYDKGLSKDEIAKALAHTHSTETDVYLDEQVIRVTSLNTMADVA